MVASGNAFLIFIICAFSLLGGVLGWATWQESRDAKMKMKKTTRG